MSRPLNLAPGEILLCWFDSDLPPALLGKLRLLLDPAELARADRFRVARDRDRFIVGRAYLRLVLARLTNRPAAALEFDCGPHGKPALRPHSASDRIHFNLSESGGLGVIAVRLDGELGVDLERVRPMQEGLAIAECFFAEEECDALRSLPETERARAFFRFWTRKEAVVKSTGLGLSSPLDGFILSPDPPGGAEVVMVACAGRRVGRLVLALDPPRPGFVAALAVAGPPGLIRPWTRQAGHRPAPIPPLTPGDRFRLDPRFPPCLTLAAPDAAGERLGS